MNGDVREAVHDLIRRSIDKVELPSAFAPYGILFHMRDAIAKQILSDIEASGKFSVVERRKPPAPTNDDFVGGSTNSEPA